MVGWPLIPSPAPRVGDKGGSRGEGAAGPRTAHPLAVVGVLSLVGKVPEVVFLIGKVTGVVARTVEGDEGDSGRRKGEERGEPKESGDGL